MNEKRVAFSVNYDDYQKLASVLKNYPGNAEKTINEYLESNGQNIVIEKTTFFIPISVNPGKKRERQHAQKNKWYETIFKNLEIDLSNSKKYYYLYYVANFLSTSNPSSRKTGVGGIDFFTSGAEIASPIIKEELLNLLEKKIKEEL